MKNSKGTPKTFYAIASPAKDRAIFGVRVGRPIDRRSHGSISDTASAGRDGSGSGNRGYHQLGYNNDPLSSPISADIKRPLPSLPCFNKNSTNDSNDRKNPNPRRSSSHTRAIYRNDMECSTTRGIHQRRMADAENINSKNTNNKNTILRSPSASLIDRTSRHRATSYDSISSRTGPQNSENQIKITDNKYKKGLMIYKLVGTETSICLNAHLQSIKSKIEESYRIDETIDIISGKPVKSVERGLKNLVDITGGTFSKDPSMWKKHFSALNDLNDSMKRDYRVGNANAPKDSFDKALLNKLKIAMDETLGSTRSQLTRLSAEVWGRLIVLYGHRMQFDGLAIEDVSQLLLRRAIPGVNPEFISKNCAKGYLAWCLYLPVNTISRMSKLLTNIKYSPVLLLHGLFLHAVRNPTWIDDNWPLSRTYFDLIVGTMKSNKRKHRDIACCIACLYVAASIKNGPFYKYAQMDGVPISAQPWFKDDKMSVYLINTIESISLEYLEI